MLGFRQCGRLTRRTGNHQCIRALLDLPVDQAFQALIIDPTVHGHRGNQGDETSFEHDGQTRQAGVRVASRAAMVLTLRPIRKNRCIALITV